MTLRSRLTLGLLIIAVILLVPLLLATRSLDRVHSEAKALRDRDFVASLMLGRLRDALNDMRSAELALLFVKDEKSRAAMGDRVREVEAVADSLGSMYQLSRTTRDVRSAMTTVQSGAQAEFEAVTSGRAPTAEAISQQQVVPAITRAEAAVRSAERTLRDRTTSRVASAASAAKNGWTAALVGLALALLVAAAVGVRLTQSISRPVQELDQGMRMVADGEFDVKLAISPTRDDEFGRLAASFAEMSRQLAELDRLKAEFVSVASHELKTPINVILGYAQLLREGLYGPLTDGQRKVAAILEQQTQTLSRLVKQLLDITRLEAGAAKLDVRPVQLTRMLKDLEQAFRVLADQRGIRFHLLLHDGTPDLVHWDHDRINEVLGNLLSNAFKFTERGGEVELSVFTTDHAIQMDVHDTGAGIPPDQLPHVFEKFFQADNQAAAAHAGTGLGLAIARQIVEAHNGTISVESTPGAGTVFTIVLPENVNGRRSADKNQPATADVA